MREMEQRLKESIADVRLHHKEDSAHLMQKLIEHDA